MSYAQATLTALLLLLAAALLLYGPTWASREHPIKAGGRREGYGPPSGRARALTLAELGPDRGWAKITPEYRAPTASALSHMIERSA